MTPEQTQAQTIAVLRAELKLAKINKTRTSDAMMQWRAIALKAESGESKGKQTIANLRKQISDCYGARMRMANLMIKFMHRARKAEKELNER